MEHLCDAMEMLDLMVQPGLCVKDRQIVKLNQPAAGLQLNVGDAIMPLLLTGAEEYEAFNGGCLYLTIGIGGRSCGASVSRVGDLDIFLLEEDTDQAELQAMALAARELREPLANVMITADRLFPLTAQNENPHMQEQVARLNRGLMQMLRVISNMSDAGRFSSGTAARPETIDVDAFLRELCDKSAALVSHAGLQLCYEGLQEPVFSFVDSQMLERAVLNLFSNAIKFTPKGGSIDVKLARKGSKLVLTVRDSGQGVADTLRGSVFRRYLRQPALEDSRFGIGLGMVLIRSAAASHGGTVLIDQPEGQGARITVTLAIRQDPDPKVRSGVLRIDYAGERDHALMELSGCLPAELYDVHK